MTYTLHKIKQINEQNKLHHNEVTKQLLRVVHPGLATSTKQVVGETGQHVRDCVQIQYAVQSRNG